MPFALDHLTNERYGFFDEDTGSALGHEVLIGPYKTFDNGTGGVSHFDGGKPPRQQIGDGQLANALFSKQKALRALFAQDGQRLEITDAGQDEPFIVCYPRLASIEFSEGQYITKAEYTITLEADTLLYGTTLAEDNARYVDHEATLIAKSHFSGSDTEKDKLLVDKTEQELIDDFNAGFVEDFNEDWAIEVDESQGENASLPRSYRITHNLSATGKTHYGPDATDATKTQKTPAWVQAKKFILNKLKLSEAGIDAINPTLDVNASGGTGYPNTRTVLPNFHYLASGTLDLIDTYRGFNHVRSENFSETAGTFSVTESWLLASGSSYENYNLNISTSNSDPFIGVSIDGNIKGLSELQPSGFGGSGEPADGIEWNSSYDNAIKKYYEISNNGQFGIGSEVYKRANNQTDVQLNSQPTSVALGVNEYDGTITYNLSFNNRPTNYITGSIAEAIQINDTYPGDVFAIIPVIGRTTGPILQYIGSRTEYKRDISVNLTMDYTRLPYSSGRNPMMLMKPSVAEPMATELQALLKELSPQGEPGVRKYFMNAPSESWNPKEGTYSFNTSFVYELDK